MAALNLVGYCSGEPALIALDAKNGCLSAPSRWHFTISTRNGPGSGCGTLDAFM